MEASVRPGIVGAYLVWFKDIKDYRGIVNGALRIEYYVVMLRCMLHSAIPCHQRWNNTNAPHTRKVH